MGAGPSAPGSSREDGSLHRSWRMLVAGMEEWDVLLLTWCWKSFGGCACNRNGAVTNAIPAEGALPSQSKSPPAKDDRNCGK